MKHNIKSNVSEVMFLIGAGAAVPIGIPAMRGIYKDFLKKTKSGITKSENKTCQLFTKKLGVEEDLEEFLLAANAITDFKSSSISSLIEKAISPQGTSGLAREYRKRLNQHIKEVITVRKRILTFMSRTCFQFERKKACVILGGFIKTVSEKGYPVYTTNYDFSMEYVARELNIDIQDNFLHKGQRFLWNPKIHFPLGENLTIIKLHGSVSWYIDDDGIIEKINSNTDINPAGKEIDRLVIFPTRFKDIYDQHFFALYSNFLSSLSETKVLFVIGHSLRDDYLRAGIVERYRKGNFQLIIIDPIFPNQLPDELRPSRLGTAGNVTHIPFKFEDFSDDLASIMLNSPTLDMSRNCAAIVHHTKSKTNKIILKGNVGILKPGDKKTFKAVIDAYLRPQEKPAYVRAWLEFTDTDGDSRISTNFLDDGKAQVCTGLSGKVQAKIPMQIKVPDYTKWIKNGSKVTLRLALLKKSVKKPPIHTNDNNILASHDRKLTYKHNR